MLSLAQTPKNPSRAAYMRAWHRKNPARTKANSRRARLKKKYGITPELYDDILRRQGGHCALCPTRPEECRYGVLRVDHDHDTNEVRGLLCDPCNHAIARLGDNIAGLQRALTYLRGGV